MGLAKGFGKIFSLGNKFIQNRIPLSTTTPPNSLFLHSSFISVLNHHKRPFKALPTGCSFMFPQIYNTMMEAEYFHTDAIQIRQEISFTNPGNSRCYSIDSEEASAQELSYLIEQLIGEEKKKYTPSKSENKFKSAIEFAKVRRLYSASLIDSSKIGYTIPKNVARVLTQNKTYPGAPDIGILTPQTDAIYGAFFGFLIGDSVGSYLAYLTKGLEEFVPNALLMNGGGTYNLGSGQGTDQTEIMLCLCYGLIEGKGQYDRSMIVDKYVQWFESKPFNFSAVFALAMRELRVMKIGGHEPHKKEKSRILLQSSLKNKNYENSIGLIRIMPLVLFGLKYPEEDFQKLIRCELSLICPNQLAIETGIVYGKMIKNVILTRDHGLAFYQASKWVYQNGSQKLIQLWKIVQQGIEIPSRGNMGKLKTSFSYACIQLNRPQPDFVDSLVKTLLKGGDAQTNCAIVMAMVGAVVGYNAIPNYFKQKIATSNMKNSPRPRDQIYSPRNILSIIQTLIKLQSSRMEMNY